MKPDMIDAVVTDPPYGLEFMGKDWDKGVPGQGFWEPLLRVMKPGAHALVFGGTRTHHRLMCALEDAGFEIRDCLMWLYGSGFPKGIDISKAIDKQAGATREVVGTKLGQPGYSLNPNMGEGVAMSGNVDGSLRKPELECQVTAPSTEEAQQWEGWNTTLKPSWEPIILVRKPLSEKTIAANVLKWGTGGLNIDGCRIPTEDNLNGGRYSEGEGLDGSSYGHGINSRTPGGYEQPLGRWPANLIIDEVTGAMLDAQSGASRFFYCAKASTKERNAGLDGKKNDHPTVKPLVLLEYLVKLVTPPGGIVLDPFCGSGSTIVAAQGLSLHQVGMEMHPEYCEIAKSRVEAARELR